MAVITGNLPGNNVNENAVNFFNNYFTKPINSSPNLNDAVLGYFQQVTGDKETGRILAATVLYTALSQGIEPMSVVEELRKLKSGKSVEQKNPIDATTVTVIESFESINEILNMGDFVTGQLFYNPTTDIFYKSKTGSEGELELATTTDFKAERINLGNGDYTFNYFYITYIEEKNELNDYLTVLLNINRVGTSLLGIKNTPVVNKYVKRTILP